MLTSERASPSAFEDLPRAPLQHFYLHFYASLYWLFHHIESLGQFGGRGLEDTFVKYPFLRAYFKSMLPFLPVPRVETAGLGWWEKEIRAWEAPRRKSLPLARLDELRSPGLPGISFTQRMALFCAGLVEEDSRLGTLYAELQEPLPHRRPALEMVGRILRDAQPDALLDAWECCGPLIDAGLLEAAQGTSARSEWTLRVPTLIWDLFKGNWQNPSSGLYRLHPRKELPILKRMILPEETLRHLSRFPSLLKGGRSGSAGAVVVRGTAASERLQVVGALARSLGRNLLEIRLDSPPAGTAADPALACAGVLAVLTCSLPVFVCDPLPGETVQLPEAKGYPGPVAAILGPEGGIKGERIDRHLSLALPLPGFTERRRYWASALGERAIPDLERMAERFQLPANAIRQVAELAKLRADLQSRHRVSLEDVAEASSSLNRQSLDTLASRLETTGTWDGLVAGEQVTTKLRELERRCRHREGARDYLGSAFSTIPSRGVKALFAGPSGTGKTLASRILSSQLGLDLYRVDLSAVVNKYIGETEKNLHRILSRAEELDVILLLDEGDSLLGNRTEVKSSNDRYANLETNFLLQRLESHQGIVFITSNAAKLIDSAFQRRLDVVVEFPLPGRSERLRLWELHLPHDHDLPSGFLERIAARCAFSGGQIRNAAFAAGMLAAESASRAGGEGRLHLRHLEESISSEYRKAGGLNPLTKLGDGGEDRVVDDFLLNLKYGG